ncbi:hypothetical protein TIFTF001_026097 [Ficus carica]|uniref:Retrotransposon gag domain-containing protein n=1 Tax=Ficus carica TaxID=3494 RepID=A0AA88AK88_FICCA|nr:hypothetical protein TIFTF001_026097 [Ficus carica]
MFEHNTDTNGDIKLMLPDLVKAIHGHVQTQNDLLQEVNELNGFLSRRGAPTKSEDKVNQQGASTIEKPKIQASEEGKRDFLTRTDVLSLLDKHLYNTHPEDLEFIPRPPYPTELYQKPYSKGYQTPNLVIFDARKGNPKEHISRFLDAFGQHAGDRSLRLREFSKSLTGRAYAWYTTLTPKTIHTWEEMNQGKNLIDYVQRFRDLALDCDDGDDEEALVGICINNIMSKYRVYLKNIGIKQFSRLMESARRASLSIKVSSGARGWKGERKERPYSLAISEGHQGRRIEGEKKEKHNLLSLALMKSFTPSSTNGSKME